MNTLSINILLATSLSFRASSSSRDNLSLSSNPLLTSSSNPLATSHSNRALAYVCNLVCTIWICIRIAFESRCNGDESVVPYPYVLIRSFNADRPALISSPACCNTPPSSSRSRSISLCNLSRSFIFSTSRAALSCTQAVRSVSHCCLSVLSCDSFSPRSWR